MTNGTDYLPLSFLNQLTYCARRFWLMYAQSELLINAPMQEGIYHHTRADQPGFQTDKHGRTLRSVIVWSDALRVIGRADFVEEHEGALIPLEHKRGGMGRWLNDHVQLCAQAICLEERTGQTITHGEILYWTNRRRERVVIDQALRDTTFVIAEQAFALLNAGQMPVPIDRPAKCKDCSMAAICLPRETLQLLAERQQEDRP